MNMTTDMKITEKNTLGFVQRLTVAYYFRKVLHPQAIAVAFEP